MGTVIAIRPLEVVIFFHIHRNYIGTVIAIRPLKQSIVAKFPTTLNWILE